MESTDEVKDVAAPDNNDTEITENDNIEKADSDKSTDDLTENDSEQEKTKKEEIETNYEDLMQKDLEELKAEFPELENLDSVVSLDNPLRYAGLRDLGLSPREAYLATSKKHYQDTRAHLASAFPKRASAPKNSMSNTELSNARELFEGLSDSEIQNLYRKVTK